MVKTKSLFIFGALLLSLLFIGVVSACCPEPTECAGADYVFNTPSPIPFNSEYYDFMWVVGAGCHGSERIQDLTTINVDSGKYIVEAKSERGNPNQSQTEEEFYLEINGKSSFISEDDSDPEAITERWENFGEFVFIQGDNIIFMNTAAPSCASYYEGSPNSVHVTKICLYKVQEPEPYCGDGTVNQVSEECDDGNNVNGDGCDAQCQIEEPEPYCGDGNLDAGEECDDGNNVDGDGCSANCVIEETGYCGDGNLDLLLGEECDDGFFNGFLCWASYGSSCTYCSNSCEIITITNYCGDGILQFCEECDDGNNDNGDGCSSECEIEEEEPVCGNGIWEMGEECDAGSSNGEVCVPGYDEECEWCNNDCEIETEKGNYCGDQKCNGNENCESCPQDCGECEDDDKPRRIGKTEFVQFCSTNWICSGWSECIDGMMTRDCYDKNSCEVEYNKPIEKTLCENELPKVYEEKQMGTFWFLIGILIFLILIIILVNLFK